MKSILDPGFRYTSSANTDLRKTFARIRREQKSKPIAAQLPAAQPPAVQPQEPANVASIFRRQRRTR